MVRVKLHSILGEKLGENWDLDVFSVNEAIHAINILSSEKFYPLLLENDKKGIKYEILINGKKFKASKPLDKLNEETINEVRNSELVLKTDTLKTIDIVPVVEGAGNDFFAIIIGVILIIVGIFAGGSTWYAAALILGGIGLVAAGVINLLSEPPKFENFTEGRQRNSYLFNGPQNTTREGGPVPVGYGRLIVGSHVISASYEITHLDADIYGDGTDGIFRNTSTAPTRRRAAREA